MNYAENKNSSQLKQEKGPIFEHMVCFVAVKLSFVTSIGLKKPKKNIGKIANLRKDYNHMSSNNKA